MAACLLAAAFAAGEGSSTNLEPVVDVVAAPYSTGLNSGLAPLTPPGLESVAGVNAVQQGAAGAQSDLQVLGGGFNSSGLAFGSVPVRNPQTEHFQAELPFPAALFESPVLVGGLSPDGQLAQHPAGTVGMRLRPMEEELFVETGAGNHDHQWFDALWQSVGGPPGLKVGSGVFGRYEMLRGMDYADNDLDAWNAGGRLYLAGNSGGFNLAAAHGERDFGARGYYGAPAGFPAAESLKDSTVLLDAGWGDDADDAVRLSGVWRRTQDEYLLDRTRPAFYRNEHDGETVAVGVDGAWRKSTRNRMLYRAVAEAESLDSSNLGDHDRSRGEGTLAWEETPRNASFRGGIRVQVFQANESVVNPLAGLTLGRKESGQFYLMYAGMSRQPSYTELYYRSISSEGNPGLAISDSDTITTGYRWEGPAMRMDAMFFTRNENHTVDWVWNPGSNRWEATDLGHVRTDGVVLSGDFALTDTLSIRETYVFTYKESDVEPYAARYVLDYPEHRYRLDIGWKVGRQIEVVTAQTVRYQTGNRMRHGGRTGVDGELQLVCHLSFARPLRLTVTCRDLWNDEFEFVPGQKAPVQLVSASLTGNW